VLTLTGTAEDWRRIGARGGRDRDRPNPLLDLPIDEPRNLTVEGSGYRGPGVRSTAVPATLSRAIVNETVRLAGLER
jgi:hypothetical protein